MKILKENNEFSWRKILTAIAAILFIVAVLGFLFGLPKLPDSYTAVIATVFVSYFAKNIKINQKNENNN